MTKGLQNQIYVYSVDTSAFYNDKESKVNKLLIQRTNDLKFLEKILNRIERFEKNLKNIEDVRNQLKKAESLEDDTNKQIILDKLQKRLTNLEAKEFKFKTDMKLLKEFMPLKEDMPCDLKVIYQNNKINKLKKKINTAKKSFKKSSKLLEANLVKLLSKHRGIRTLRKDALYDKDNKPIQSNLISQFESTLTRSLGLKKGQITNDIMVIRAYRYVVFENIIKFGYKGINGEHYQYFTSSAGNIRKKKSMFIKSSMFKEVGNKLMCGLSVKQINWKKGMNLNKYQSYKALCTTSSIPWTEFEIDKSIVVPDFETEIKDVEVDYIDDKTFKIQPKKMPIKINHVDGAGMYLAEEEGVEYKSFQFRMPFFKGLIIPFPYKKFINQFNGNPVIKDIYGKEHDVVKEDIRYIFTASQFKMAKYFMKNNKDKEAWETYKDNFRKYKCEAAKCREDEEIFNDKPLNYQVIQSLHDITVPEGKSDGTSEIERLAQNTIDSINKMGNDLDTMLKELGADESNDKKNPFQQALSIYPNLINDTYSKEVIKEKRLSMKKEARAGKLILEGSKRTFIAPDLFAFCEWLFLGEKHPQGLLANGEVSCRLYKENQKLDVLRSPHNYLEHCVRINKVNEVLVNNEIINIREWFLTNAIHTSVHDLISKVLQFDVDGDESLIVSNPLFVSIAERNMKGIKPLQYKLEKATEEIINNENIYNGLISAYSKSQEIGELANLISKVWNSGEITNEKLNLIARSCYLSNCVIDFAKTLWIPKCPPEIEKELKKYRSMKVPYFFRFAKDKTEKQVQERNMSPVNSLYDIVPKTNINFEEVVEPFDYKNLMSKKESEVKIYPKVIELYTELDQGKNKLIKDQLKNSDKKRKGVELQVYQEIRKKLLKLNGNYNELVDMLVKHLYSDKDSKHKQTLWHCFGNVLVTNLKYNVKGENVKVCDDCGHEIKRAKAKKRCTECSKIRKNESNKKWKRAHKKGRKNKAS